jgi:hypothetical protein
MNTSERLLAKHLAKTAIHGLKKRAGALERLAANPGDTELSQADLSRQIVTTLSRMGVRKLSDLAHRSKSELWRQSELSASDIQRILRICRDHGVAVKQD